MANEEPVVVPPSARENEALKIVKTYANWSILPGFLPTPAVDIALLIAFQLRMIDRLANFYNLPFSKDLGKSILVSLVGGLVPTTAGFGVAGYLVRTVPVLGGLLGLLFMPAFAWACTYAVGKVFVQHFESGGTFLTFDPEKVRGHFRQEFDREYALRTTLGAV